MLFSNLKLAFMKKTLHYLLLAVCFSFVTHINALAQHIYPGDFIGDTTTFNFAKNDSLSHRMSFGTYAIDTTNMEIWEIGNTVKSFFTSDTTTIRGIMTDTTHSYPVNANSSFTLRIIPTGFNIYFSFWHKYQTAARHDGGIVEFSADGGITWQNMLGDCNGDSMFTERSILTDNFYGRNDTLLSGEPAFSGISSGWQLSKFQFFTTLPIRLSGGGPGCLNDTETLVRFRFKSDSIPDSLDGWIISSIKVELDLYSGVSTINKSQTLKVFPNPSIDGVFNFPALEDEGKYSMEIFNAVGDKVYTGSYKHDVNLSSHARGVYFYKVGNGIDYYSGTISDK